MSQSVAAFLLHNPEPLILVLMHVVYFVILEILDLGRVSLVDSLLIFKSHRLDELSVKSFKSFRLEE